MYKWSLKSFINRTLLACNAFREVFRWVPLNPTAALPFALTYLFPEGNFSGHLFIQYFWLWLLQVLPDYYTSWVGFDFSVFLSMKLKTFRTGFYLTRWFNTDVLLYLPWLLFFCSYTSFSHLRIIMKIISSASFANSLQLWNSIFVVFGFRPRAPDFSLRDYSSSLVLCKICH